MIASVLEVCAEGGRKHYRLQEGERRGRRMSESKRKVCSITVGSRGQ